MTDVCQSYRSRDMVCRDGFVQTPACYGARCHACGDWSADRKLPNCLREDLPTHWITDGGKPLFYARTRELREID